MNRYIKRLSLGIALLTSANVFAQDKLIPNDQAVVQGKLPNGFRYYIRHNVQPAGRATLFLVTKAGSALEQENEQGIAHFIEHMNFNGTKHFPKNELINYLEKAGVRFGADLNAYTAFDETVYQLPLPTDDPELWKNGLLIMHDWATDATISKGDFDGERGVILEEKRMRNNVAQRLQDKYRKVLFSNSPYADRMPIGMENVIRNADVSLARKFYDRWYRPDLQALIIAGDIDPKKVEKEVIQLFSGLKAARPAVKRPQYRVELQDAKSFVKLGDAEYGQYTMDWYYKFHTQAVTTENQFKEQLLRTIISRLIAARFGEIAGRNKPAYLNGTGGIAPVVADVNALRFRVTLNPERINAGIQDFLSDMEQIRRYGFSVIEIERVKDQLKLSTKNQLAEQDKTGSSDLAEDYLDHFLKGDHYPSVTTRSELTVRCLASVTVSEINKSLQVMLGAKDVTTILLAPQKGIDDLPDRKQLDALTKAAAKTAIKPFESAIIPANLMDWVPAPGSIVSESGPDSADITRWKLANGVTVYLKPSHFKNDEVLISAFRSGGTAAFNLQDSYSAKNATAFILSSGVGRFDATQLSQVLNGKGLQVRPYLADRYEGFRGASTTKDLPTAMELIHLYMTAPRLDTAVFSRIIAQSKASFRKRGDDPGRDFSDTVSYVLSGRHPRRKPMSFADFDKIDSGRVLKAFRERFSNPAGLNFVFVGNLNMDTLKKLVTTYLGNIAGDKAPEPAADLSIRVPEGRITKVFNGGKDQKATVQMVISGRFLYNQENLLYLDLLNSALQSRLLSRLREKEGGIYSPTVLVSPAKDPINFYAFTIAFQCDPARADSLVAAARQEIDQLAKEGVTPDELQKFKAEELRSYEVSVKNNEYWAQQIQQELMDGQALPDLLSYPAHLQKLDAKTAREMSAKFLSRDNEILFIQLPK